MVFQKQLTAAVVFGLCFSVSASVGAATKGVSASQFPCHSVEIEGAPVASFGCLKGGKGSFSADSMSGWYTLVGKNAFRVHLTSGDTWVSETMPGNKLRSGRDGKTHRILSVR